MCVRDVLQQVLCEQTVGLIPAPLSRLRNQKSVYSIVDVVVPAAAVVVEMDQVQHFFVIKVMKRDVLTRLTLHSF